MEFFKATETNDVLQEEIWSILEDISGLSGSPNRRSYHFVHTRARLKESSFGWNVQEKREEVFHPDGRLMVLFLDSHGSENGARVAGFCSFRFEEEALEDILYWYVCIRQSPLALG